MMLEILSPEQKLFSGEVESVTLPGTLGEFTVLKRHAPLISSMFFNTANKNPEWIDFDSQHKPKISPVTGFDTSTGSLRVGFAWHGDFGRCFDEWAYVKAQFRLPH